MTNTPGKEFVFDPEFDQNINRVVGNDINLRTDDPEEIGKFYTFVYNANTPGKAYDQHPLIACTSLEKWGFKGINFHWRQSRNYTWQELAGQLYIVQYHELDDLMAIPYGKFILNK